MRDILIFHDNLSNEFFARVFMKQAFSNTSVDAIRFQYERKIVCKV